MIPLGYQHNQLRLAEVVSALSYALDLTDGQPAGHSVRCCWIGTKIGQVLRLADAEMSDLYYTLLLKDLGCSSNAARICQLFVTNDHDFKRNVKLVDNSLSHLLRFVAANTAVRSGLKDRLQTLIHIALNNGTIDRDLIVTRCERGAEIARRMRFSEPVARGILDLDEHWDGRGQPRQFKGVSISLNARIALIAQVVDVFHRTTGQTAARLEVRRRSGKWFDPQLVDAFEWAADDVAFWDGLEARDLDRRVFELEPGNLVREVDESLLDDLADGFSQVVDAKSPFTNGHSKRVALVSDLIAVELGLAPDHRRTLTRSALLHDIGKLGVSNQILDKPGKLEENEWAAIKRHPSLGADILSRVTVFAGAASIAEKHHEKLNGTGYPHGLCAADIDLDTRIVTVADIFDALTADRPYRTAMPTAEALAIIQKDVGTALDRDCFEALCCSLDRLTNAA